MGSFESMGAHNVAHARHPADFVRGDAVRIGHAELELSPRLSFRCNHWWGPIEIDPDSAAASLHNVVAGQAASDVRSVDFSRTGFPPGGFRGDGSRLDSASRISSMETIRLAPGMARKDGHEVTAAASDAQEARMALFSARDSVVSARTSRG